MPCLFLLTATFAVLATLLPVSFADEQLQIFFATAGQPTVLLLGNWVADPSLELPQIDGSLVSGSAIESTTYGDRVFVQLPFGTSSLTGNGVLQAGGSVGVVCLDCGSTAASAPVLAAEFNTSLLPTGEVVERSLFTFSAIDPLAQHNLTIINGQNASLILTRLFLNVTGTIPPFSSTILSQTISSTPIAMSLTSVVTPTASTSPPLAQSPTPTQTPEPSRGADGAAPSTTPQSSSSNGLSSQQIAAAVLISVLGSLALALGAFIIYFTRIRRLRRQRRGGGGTSPPPAPMFIDTTAVTSAQRATFLTTGTPILTPGNSAVLNSVFSSPPPMPAIASPELPTPPVSAPPAMAPGQPTRPLWALFPPSPRTTPPVPAQSRRAVVSLPASLRRLSTPVRPSPPALHRTESRDLMLTPARNGAPPSPTSSLATVRRAPSSLYSTHSTRPPSPYLVPRSPSPSLSLFSLVTETDSAASAAAAPPGLDFVMVMPPPATARMSRPSGPRPSLSAPMPPLSAPVPMRPRTGDPVLPPAPLPTAAPRAGSPWRKSSAGDPVLPRSVPSPGPAPSLSLSSLGRRSTDTIALDTGERGGETRWSGGYPESIRGASSSETIAERTRKD